MSRSPTATSMPQECSRSRRRLTLRALITNWRAEHVPERRGYLLSRVKDDWSNVARAVAVPLDDVIARLREG
ncbi:hypothetical protein QA802_28340 [Streptomyces sp. B21-105]|uniref:hypothetical protein n=1 Tax=Streptomyces sp. B21-105 TaxID=3039417 RepID=UPI002FF1833D